MFRLIGMRRESVEQVPKKSASNGFRRAISYPMGAFDAKSKKAVEDAGYAGAVSTSPRGVAPDDIYAIKRVRISRSANNLFVFWADTTRLYTWFKRHKEAE